MRIQAYLLIDSHGSIEVRKRLPSPHLKQLAVRLIINISDEWFQRPVPSIELSVPNDHVQPMIAIQTEPLPEEEQGYAES